MWIGVGTDADQSLPGLFARLEKSETGLSRPRKECNERVLCQRMTGRTNGQRERLDAVEEGKKRRESCGMGGLYFDGLVWTP